EGDWSASAGFDGTVKLLALEQRPTAIFCQNDRMAIGCYEALKEAGLSIPEDMSVVGYDDEEISRHLHPQLTTVILPHRQMGQWAVQALAASEKARPVPVARLECSLVSRASVARPAGAS
ncbi:MAG: LacI family transcriptional regulator, partial [Hyphomicrobiales bacterium]